MYMTSLSKTIIAEQSILYALQQVNIAHITYKLQDRVSIISLVIVYTYTQCRSYSEVTTWYPVSLHIIRTQR